MLFIKVIVVDVNVYVLVNECKVGVYWCFYIVRNLFMSFRMGSLMKMNKLVENRKKGKVCIKNLY